MNWNVNNSYGRLVWLKKTEKNWEYKLWVSLLKQTKARSRLFQCLITCWLEMYGGSMEKANYVIKCVSSDCNYNGVFAYAECSVHKDLSNQRT